MPKKIVWSPLAQDDISDISEYLSEEWNNKTANHFISIVDHLVDHISINPRQFPEIHPELKVRKCVITKHNSIYYRVLEDQIDILRIFDTRQDPEKLRF
jgi:plasmid stabilization system protein ParE